MAASRAQAQREATVILVRKSERRSKNEEQAHVVARCSCSSFFVDLDPYCVIPFFIVALASNVAELVGHAFSAPLPSQVAAEK